MAEEYTSLTTIYQGWDVYQGYLHQTIAPLTDVQLTLRVTPNERSAYEIIAHLIAVRARWFSMLGEAGPEIEPINAWDRKGQPIRSAAELIQGLEATWQMLQTNLARWTTADLGHIYHETYQGEENSFTRQWLIWHVIEHDIHHGGELFLTLGSHGLATPDM